MFLFVGKSRLRKSTAYHSMLQNLFFSVVFLDVAFYEKSEGRQGHNQPVWLLTPGVSLQRLRLTNCPRDV